MAQLTATRSEPRLGSYRWHRRAWRRWDGARWRVAEYSPHPARLKDAATEPSTHPMLSAQAQQRLLDIAVDLEVLAGSSVVHRSERGVTLARRRPVSHVTHFLMTLVTGGIWGFVWLAMCLARKEDRVRYEVDPWGNVWPAGL